MRCRLLCNYVGPDGEPHEAGQLLPEDLDPEFVESLVASGGGEWVEE